MCHFDCAKIVKVKVFSVTWVNIFIIGWNSFGKLSGRHQINKKYNYFVWKKREKKTNTSKRKRSKERKMARIEENSLILLLTCVHRKIYV